jgi:hypothetical protein
MPSRGASLPWPFENYRKIFARFIRDGYTSASELVLTIENEHKK